MTEWTSELEKFQFSTEVRVRLPETDAMGIVFHGSFFTFLEVARVDYLRNLGLIDQSGIIKGFGNVVIKANCEFRSPARFDDELVVKVRISNIGRSSFRFEFRITHKRENRLVALGEAVHCVIDLETWTPNPVPEEFRAVIRPKWARCSR